MSDASVDPQEMSQQLQVLQAQIQELTRERETLRATIEDIGGAIDALERLESGSTVQVPLGGNAYVRATIEDIDEVLVDIGGGFSAERSREGAIDTLEERQSTVEGRVEAITERLGELESETGDLERQLQQVVAAQQQQQRSFEG
ncbi:MAG: prefoldin subunit alpha [Halobacteriales archaeon]